MSKIAVLSRKSLEDIVKITLRKVKYPSLSQKKDISSMLAGIIKNKINAAQKKYDNILQDQHSCITNWVMLKALLGREVLNNLFARLDKHIFRNR